MKKLIVSLIVALIIIASWFFFDLSKYLPPDLIFNKGIKYESEEIQRKIAQELNERNIPYRINDEGFIKYRKKDDEIIKQIADKIHLAFYPIQEIKQPDPNIHFSDIGRRTKLIRLLEHNNIPYRIEKFDKEGNDYVVWDPQYNKIVRKLIKDIYEEAGEQPPSNISFPTEEQNQYFMSLLEQSGIWYNIVEKTINGEKSKFVEYESEDEDKIRELKIKVLKEKPIDIDT